MAWVLLFLAGLCEVAWAVGLKSSQGFTRFWPSLFTIVTLAASLILLGLSLRSLPLGTAYAVWTGIGAVGTVLLGMTVLGEPFSWSRLFCVALILGGILGLKLVTATNVPS